MSLTRPEIHNAIRVAAEELIRLFDASEDAATAEQHERADKELYDFALALLADVAGPAIGRVLERERDCPLPDEVGSSIKATWQDNRNGVRKALARLLLDLEPALGTFPTKPVMRDIIAAATDNASALTLADPARTRGERDHRDLVRTARKRLVFAIVFCAGQTGQSVDKARDSLTNGDVTESTWKNLLRDLDLTIERRRAVKDAGKAQSAAELEGRPHTLSDPDAVQANADLKDGLRVLIDLGVAQKGAKKSLFP